MLSTCKPSDSLRFKLYWRPPTISLYKVCMSLYTTQQQQQYHSHQWLPAIAKLVLVPGTTWCQTVLVLWSIDKIIWQSPPRHYIYRVKYKPAARPYSPRPLIMGIIKTKTHQSILLLLDLTNCSIIDLFLTSFDWIEPEKHKIHFHCPLSINI